MGLPATQRIVVGNFKYPQNLKFPPRPIFRLFCGPLASLAKSLSHSESHEFKFFAISTSIHACTKDKDSCSPEKNFI